MKGVFSTVGAGPLGRTGVPKGSHLTAVTIEMVSAEYRTIGAEGTLETYQRQYATSSWC